MTKSGRRLARLLTVSLVAFLSVALGAVILILVWAPTLSSSRMVAFLASMFALTAGIITAAVIWGGGGEK